MKMRVFGLVFFIAFFTSCDESSTSGQAEIDLEKEISGFSYPDSIVHRQIIATFYDQHNSIHGVIYWTDETQKNAAIVKYLPDGSATVDQLWALKSNEFTSINSKVVYTVGEETVGYINPVSGANPSMDYMRTDALKINGDH